jgi:hypothetical protein
LKACWGAVEEAFVLCDDGSIWQSSLRLAREGTIDWSTWVSLPLPPGHVTAIVTCRFDQRPMRGLGSRGAWVIV